MKKIFAFIMSFALATTIVHAKPKENSMKLSERKQSIVAVSSLAAVGELDALKKEVDTALERGLSVNDLGEIFLQLYAYAGFPRSLNAQSVLNETLLEREKAGKKVVYGSTPAATPEKDRYDIGRETINQIFNQKATQKRPEKTGFTETTDVFLKEHLFADITNRANMNIEEREMATASMLAGIGNVNPQLAAHFNGALNSGNSVDEMRSAVKIIGLKLGKQKEKNANAVLENVLKDREKNNEKNPVNAYPPEAKVSPFPVGVPNDGYAQYFVGNSYLAPLTDKNSPIFIANVTFEPGCRNNWHIHHATKGGGQILIAVGGRGLFQEEGKPVRTLNPGDIVVIPAGVKHWHGATPDSWFSHLSLEVPGENTKNEWLEKVSDKEYKKK